MVGVRLGNVLDAFLLIGIGAGNDRLGRFGLAEVDRLMRQIGGDIDEVARFVDNALLRGLRRRASQRAL